MRVLVVTVVHHPLDARILSRQIGALVAAGHDITYAAPWADTGTEPPSDLTAVDLPRAVGRRRLVAVRAARRMIRERAGTADLVLLHDPELVPTVCFLDRPPTVWDVHEDVAASLGDRAWIPRWARPFGRIAVRLLERWAERRLHLLLAEESYAERFRFTHPVVPNEPPVPEHVAAPDEHRVVYLGRVSKSRGAEQLAALAREVGDRVPVHVVGDADDGLAPLLEETPGLEWHGRLPYDAALDLLDGAMAGLSLLADEPNFRRSRPTKVIDYLSRGVPVITTPNPIAAQLVEEHQCGFVVAFNDTVGVAEAVEYLRTHPTQRREMGERGHATAVESFDWHVTGHQFVELLEQAARSLN